MQVFWNWAVSVSNKELSEEIKEYFFAENEDDYDFDYFQRTLEAVLKSRADAEIFINNLMDYMNNLTNPENYANISEFIKESLQGVSKEKVSFERFFALDESYKDEEDSFRFGLNERFINFGLQLCLQNGVHGSHFQTFQPNSSQADPLLSTRNGLFFCL